MADGGNGKLLKLIIAFFLPPIGAFLQVGVSFHLFLNIVLCLLFYIPGTIHALWLVATDKRA